MNRTRSLALGAAAISLAVFACSSDDASGPAVSAGGTDAGADVAAGAAGKGGQPGAGGSAGQGGAAGAGGTGGLSGAGGAAGKAGAAGAGGKAGSAGAAGAATGGGAGTSGAAGSAGAAGQSDAGTDASAGSAGVAGTAGAAGADAGIGGAAGADAGMDGAAGMAGNAGTAGAGGAPVDGGASGTWVSGYYVGYQSTIYPPAAVDFADLTHLIVGRVTPNADGTLDTTFDIDAVNGPLLAKDLSTRAHQAGKKAILMIGGAGEHAGWVGAASAANRAAFVQNLLAFMDAHGYDGLDLDWEPLNAADYAPFKALASELRAARPSMLLTVPVGWVSANFPNLDSIYVEVAPLFDQLNIMSYGMADAWPGWKTWHSSALIGHTGTTPSSIDSSVSAYITAGVPAAKLGMGIGFYGSCWTEPVTGPLQNANGSYVVASDNTMSFANIWATYFVPQARYWDNAAKVPYLSFPVPTGPQACTFISYDDEESIAQKGAYAKQKGLGGTIIWTINQGYIATKPAGQRDPLLKAVAQAFLQ